VPPRPSRRALPPRFRLRPRQRRRPRPRGRRRRLVHNRRPGLRSPARPRPWGLRRTSGAQARVVPTHVAASLAVANTVVANRMVPGSRAHPRLPLSPARRPALGRVALNPAVQPVHRRPRALFQEARGHRPAPMHVVRVALQALPQAGSCPRAMPEASRICAGSAASTTRAAARSTASRAARSSARTTASSFATTRPSASARSASRCEPSGAAATQ
jgi:hypothetical protein